MSMHQCSYMSGYQPSSLGLVVKPACTVTIGLVVKPVCTVAQRLSDTARLVTAQCVTIKFSNFAQATP